MIFTVTEVTDGDTIKVFPYWTYPPGRLDSRVRIAGIYAPERGQFGYIRAKRQLTNILLNQQVRLEAKAIDVYGRLVSDVYLLTYQGVRNVDVRVALRALESEPLMAVDVLEYLQIVSRQTRY